MQEIIFKIRYFERGLSKSLKIVHFIFSFKPTEYNLEFQGSIQNLQERALLNEVLPRNALK